MNRYSRAPTLCATDPISNGREAAEAIGDEPEPIRLTIPNASINRQHFRAARHAVTEIAAIGEICTCGIAMATQQEILASERMTVSALALIFEIDAGPRFGIGGAALATAHVQP